MTIETWNMYKMPFRGEIKQSKTAIQSQSDSYLLMLIIYIYIYTGQIQYKTLNSFLFDDFFVLVMTQYNTLILEKFSKSRFLILTCKNFGNQNLSVPVVSNPITRLTGTQVLGGFSYQSSAERSSVVTQYSEQR